METMKAIVAEKYGSPDVLRLMEVKKPVPRDREILIKVHATTVNVGDTRMRGFTVPALVWIPARIALGLAKPRNPIFGMELAGEIEAVGKEVKRFQVGDPVFASMMKAGFGAHAEYACLPEDAAVVSKPENLTYEEAAALPIGANTALHFLRKGNIERGHKVLIIGASGSVGTFAVQLAKHFGADVTGVCSGANAEWVQSIGADRVIDYTKEDYTKNGQTYDIVFDTVLKTTFWQCRNLLVKGGHYLTAGPVALGPLYRLTTGKRVIGGGAAQTTDKLEFLKQLSESGGLRPVIDRRYPLERTAEAHRYVELGHKKGNVVITV